VLRTIPMSVETCDGTVRQFADDGGGRFISYDDIFAAMRRSAPILAAEGGGNYVLGQAEREGGRGRGGGFVAAAADEGALCVKVIRISRGGPTCAPIGKFPCPGLLLFARGYFPVGRR
jgi:hypothetical protein